MDGYKKLSNNSLSQKNSLENINFTTLNATTINTTNLNATTINGSNGTYFNNLSSNIQSQLNTQNSTINNNYTDLRNRLSNDCVSITTFNRNMTTISDEIYNISQNYPTMDQILTTSGIIFYNVTGGGFFSMVFNGNWNSVGSGYNFYNTNNYPVLGCDCYLDSITIVFNVSGTNAGSGQLMINNSVFFTVSLPSATSNNTAYTFDARNSGLSMINRFSKINFKANTSSTLGQCIVTLTFSTAGVIGPQGLSIVGPQGVQGPMFSLSGLIFTSTQPPLTLSYGSTPSVSITQLTISNIIYCDFLFGIPEGQSVKGDRGDKGDTGDRGDKGDKGNNGNNGSNGSNGSGGMDAIAILGLIIAIIGMLGLGAGEISLQFQVLALALKTACINCIPPLTTITGDLLVNSPTTIDMNSLLVMNLYAQAAFSVESSVASVYGFGEANLSSDYSTNITAGNTITIDSGDIIAITSASDINIIAPNINLIGNVNNFSNSSGNVNSNFKFNSNGTMSQVNDLFGLNVSSSNVNFATI